MGIDMLGNASILHYSNISMILGGIFYLQSIEQKNILFLNTNLGIFFFYLFILWYLKKKKIIWTCSSIGNPLVESWNQKPRDPVLRLN